MKKIIKFCRNQKKNSKNSRKNSIFFQTMSLTLMDSFKLSQLMSPNNFVGVNFVGVVCTTLGDTRGDRSTRL